MPRKKAAAKSEAEETTEVLDTKEPERPKQNRDLVGWIKIEQTTVDYPDVSGARVLSAKNCEETLKKSIP